MARLISPNQQFFDANGDPLNGGKLEFFETGTSTPKNTYSDSGLATPNTNPVILDAAGRAGDVFMESGAYRVILKNSADVTIWDADPVDGAAGATGAVRSIDGSETLTVSDGSKVILVDASSGDVTVTLLAAATAGDGFEVTIKKTDASLNSVTIDGNGSETIDGATTMVLTRQYQAAVLRCDGSNWHLRNNPSLVQADADVASAAALAVDIDGNFFDVTGTTTITSLNSKGLGAVVVLQFDGALTLTHHATDLVLPGAANIATAAGDIAVFWEYGIGDWRLVSYLRADSAVVQDVATQAEMETAAATDKIVTPGRQHFHPGHIKAFVNFDGSGALTINESYNVAGVSDDGTGLYTPSWDTDFSAAASYGIVGFAGDTAATTNQASLGVNNEAVGVGAKAAGNYPISVETEGGTNADADDITIMAVGDQ